MARSEWRRRAEALIGRADALVGVVKATPKRSDLPPLLPALSDEEFLDYLYHQLLGRSPDPAGRAHHLAHLTGGGTRFDMVADVMRSDESEQFASRSAETRPVDDEAFVQDCYFDLLERVPDRAGVAHQVEGLRQGMTRWELVANLARSDEYRRKILSESTVLADLTALRPERYGQRTELGSNRTVAVFEAEGPEDYDWLEAAILEHNYYEKPGVWSYEMDDDKRMSARMLSAFAPDRALELGCSNGTVMAALADLGVVCEGVDVSSAALDHADPRVRDLIHLGDLLDVKLSGGYGLVFGLDVFEHLNPNRLDDYLERVAKLVASDGFVVVNVPAFGPDEGFGNVFPFYLEGWEDQAGRGSMLSPIEVDRRGYPIHGHLVWADSAWWVNRFEQTGLTRAPEIEAALHDRYDRWIVDHSPARRAFYVFAAPAAGARCPGVVERIRCLDPV